MRDGHGEPTVERLPGPTVRLTISTATTVEEMLPKCRQQLHDAVEWAINSVFADEAAPGRVYVRDAGGLEFITMVDPCATYGLQAIVRP